MFQFASNRRAMIGFKSAARGCGATKLIFYRFNDDDDARIGSDRIGLERGLGLGTGSGNEASPASGSRRVKAYKIRQRTEAHNSADGPRRQGTERKCGVFLNKLTSKVK